MITATQQEVEKAETLISQLRAQQQEDKKNVEKRIQHMEEELKHKEVEIQQLRLRLLKKDAPEPTSTQAQQSQTNEPIQIVEGVLSPRELIESIRADKGVGVKVDPVVQQCLKGLYATLEKAIDKLADDIYSDGNHFALGTFNICSI
jgi:hypothetical protein